MEIGLPVRKWRVREAPIAPAMPEPERERERPMEKPVEKEKETVEVSVS